MQKRLRSRRWPVRSRDDELCDASADATAHVRPVDCPYRRAHAHALINPHAHALDQPQPRHVHRRGVDRALPSPRPEPLAVAATGQVLAGCWLGATGAPRAKGASHTSWATG